eukprot:Clim_evm16s26 gene=Clim_evmTU16s26
MSNEEQNEVDFSNLDILNHHTMDGENFMDIFDAPLMQESNDILNQSAATTENDNLFFQDNKLGSSNQSEDTGYQTHGTANSIERGIDALHFPSEITTFQRQLQAKAVPNQNGSQQQQQVTGESMAAPAALTGTGATAASKDVVGQTNTAEMEELERERLASQKRQDEEIERLKRRMAQSPKFRASRKGSVALSSRGSKLKRSSRPGTPQTKADRTPGSPSMMELGPSAMAIRKGSGGAPSSSTPRAGLPSPLSTPKQNAANYTTGATSSTNRRDRGSPSQIADDTSSIHSRSSRTSSKPAGSAAPVATSQGVIPVPADVDLGEPATGSRSKRKAVESMLKDTRGHEDGSKSNGASAASEKGSTLVGSRGSKASASDEKRGNSSASSATKDKDTDNAQAAGRSPALSRQFSGQSPAMIPAVPMSPMMPPAMAHALSKSMPNQSPVLYPMNGQGQSYMVSPVLSPAMHPYWPPPPGAATQGYSMLKNSDGTKSTATRRQSVASAAEATPSKGQLIAKKMEPRGNSGPKRLTAEDLASKSNYEQLMSGRGDELGFSSDMLKTVEDRRKVHKDSEQKRRDDLRQAFQELRKLVTRGEQIMAKSGADHVIGSPHQSSERDRGEDSKEKNQSNKNEMESKASILKRSIAHVKSVHEVLYEKDRLLRKALEELALLKGENRSKASTDGEDNDAANGRKASDEEQSPMSVTDDAVDARKVQAAARVI